MNSLVLSANCFSQGYLYSSALYRSAMGWIEKLIDPILNVASSGLSAGTTFTLSAAVISAVPPVVTQTITLLCAFMPEAISLYTAGPVVGFAVLGSLGLI